jgi:Flp pilus assembly protein TadG
MTRRDEKGQVVVWMLAVVVVVLFLGGVPVDLWRAFSVERLLSADVDGAALAASSGIDETMFRTSDGRTLQLDPDRARQLASDNLSGQPDAAELVDVQIGAEPQLVSVAASRPVRFTLLGIFIREPLVMHATSTANPRRST